MDSLLSVLQAKNSRMSSSPKLKTCSIAEIMSSDNKSRFYYTHIKRLNE